ncbi:universal stress protein [Geobacter sp.]|uniref:universal stress protein n=1 Tax=Geobacter sp. TaxID=46610 RepID=UPI00260E076F|nr:universal stress protein [Geobacter sp.]
MTFKDVLVHVDNTQQCTARLDLAVGLAKRHRAHLTGLYVISYPHYRPRHESTELKAAEAEASFRQKTAQVGISAEWLCVDWAVAGVSMTEIVTLHAYHRDLVIVGQTHEGDTPPDLPERVVSGSGRPVLIVPYAGTFETVGEQVMVAWKPGRESVRALNDAMPFLLDARQATVVTVNSSDSGEDLGNVCTHLARHGVTAKGEELMAGDIPVGDMLLNQAWEDGSDLLVMGAYTHTIRGTFAIGQVARHVLRHMTMPVLMSH